MKKTLVLIALYIAFIALGMPDALWGSGWTIIHTDLGVPLSYLGLITTTSFAVTVTAAGNGPLINRKFETRYLIIFGLFIASASIFMMGRVTEYYQILFFAIPLGAGHGVLDFSVNNYMSDHYDAHHMNFLHGFYGIGLMIGPLLMAYALNQEAWRLAFTLSSFILITIGTLVALFTPLFEHADHEERKERHIHINTKEALGIPGAKVNVAVYLLFINLESLGGAWIASYLFSERGISAVDAALFTSIFVLGFVVGRLGAGFISMKIHPRTIVSVSFVIILISSVLFLLPFEYIILIQIAAFLYGFGVAPLFANMMFLNKLRYEKKYLSKMISLEMAIGYLGFGVVTPLYGLLFEKTTLGLFPYVVLITSTTLIVLNARLNKLTLKTI